MAKILVIGSGIIGITSAIRLIQAGHQVNIHTKDTYSHTTSYIAAAMWEPCMAGPVEKVQKWSVDTYKVFEKQALDKACGVDEIKAIHYLLPEELLPPWAGDVKELEQKAFSQLTDCGAGQMISFRTFVADMSYYMPYLIDELHFLGGTISAQVYTDLNEAPKDYDIIVNCTGLASRQLAKDEKLFPARGILLKALPKTVKESLNFNKYPNGMGYVIPRRDYLCLGGAYNKNIENTEVSQDEIEEIYNRCVALYPVLKGTKITGVTVGFRPCRDEIRLEYDTSLGRPLIHNYGHGGSGVTVCWGCANDVVKMVEEKIYQ